MFRRYAFLGSECGALDTEELLEAVVDMAKTFRLQGAFGPSVF